MFESVRDKHFPMNLSAEVTAQPVDKATFGSVWKTYADAVERPFEELGNFAMPEERYPKSRDLREVYAATHEENIVFYKAGQPVGWSSGAMLEPSTYFMAYSAVLPDYQRQGLYSRFVKAFLPYLYELGYERVTSNHMVNNRAVLIAKLKLGFFISGMMLDERYGAQVALSHLFHEDRREGFARAYSLQNYRGVPTYDSG